MTTGTTHDEERESDDAVRAAAAASAEDEDTSRDDESDDDGDEGDDEPASGKPAASGQASVAKPTDGLGLSRASATSIVFTIARREIASYFNSALAYIVIGVSTALLGLYFFFYRGGFWQVDRATMARMFEAAPVALTFLTVPLFTMRSLSEEKRMGTIELLITMPVKDSEVILGKYIASLTMVLIQLALLVAYPLVMFVGPWQLGPFDWGPFWTGMLGLALLSAAGVAIGMMMSSFTESQILSYFATMVTLLALYGIGATTIVEYLQGWPGDVVAFVSLQTRFEPFARGLIDTRALVYFISVATMALLVAFRSLESRKWS